MTEAELQASRIVALEEALSDCRDAFRKLQAAISPLAAPFSCQPKNTFNKQLTIIRNELSAIEELRLEN